MVKCKLLLIYEYFYGLLKTPKTHTFN